MFAHVALPLPVRQTFAYRIPGDLAARVRPGVQVQVPFRGRAMRGIVLAVDGAAPAAEPRDVAAVLEDAPIAPHLLELGRWIADYYLAPIGEVLTAALPGGLEGFAKSRARRAAVEDSGLRMALPERVTLTAGQQAALAEVERAFGTRGFAPVLLHGVTASGKTEIYLRAAAAARERGRQTLVLVPEVALGSQLVAEFRRRFGGRVGVLHSYLGTGERRRNWELASRGALDVVVGARSAVFAPLPQLGLVVVDEEHEPAYKQSERLRYHGRDTAVRRAQMLGIPVLLGSATPSLESLANAARGKYRRVRLAERVDARPLPKVLLVDLRREGSARGLLTATLRDAIALRLERGEQAMLFLNRRGHSPHTQCRACGWVPECPHCDIALTLHLAPRAWRCHYCDHEQPAGAECPQCGHGLFRYTGSGTQKIERELAEVFPQARVLRLDTDITREREAAARVTRTFRAGGADILVGTQMIAKGFDFPNVTLVGVLDADVGLHLADFRAGERTHQLLVQVSGRAGRGRVAGEVYIQTCTPEHPAVAAAVLNDDRPFLEHELQQRRDACYPPFVRLVSLLFAGREEEHVEAVASTVAEFLRAAALAEVAATAAVRAGDAPELAAVPDSGVAAMSDSELPAVPDSGVAAVTDSGVAAVTADDDDATAAADAREPRVLGPAPHAFARRRGLHRWHVLLKGADGRALRGLAARALDHFETLAGKRGVKMAVDVDPIDVL